MPALDMDNPDVTAVDTFGNLLSSLLDEASAFKQTSSIEPALNKSDFADLTTRVDAALPQQDSDATDGQTASSDNLKARHFAIAEGASRDLFGALIASIAIDSPDFVRMWNFLDILSILSDSGQCDPALVFWLVEELLDSQTIAGCRHIFDFLESRRERITARNFSQKKLVILRSCNELLRRLSRAEDTAFCGRVFIFMFQCFPLGDRSSVNLRGEYHVENVTTYEVTANYDISGMDVDAETAPVGANGDKKGDARGTLAKEGSRLSSEELYPLLWSLQESFSQPTTLFDAAKFSHFKYSLEETMKAFESLPTDDQRSLKRKRNEDGTASVPEAFNPKYLTSQDLFELEISDLSFRRHVLVQALIITEFLLSLSPEAKQRLSSLPASNKAIVYSDQLSEENTKWATDTKRRISEYLKQGFDGPYFFRMVETVLARDKNWVFWKMASCPPIEREPVTASDFVKAKSSAQHMAASKRLRPTPMGAVSMEFLNKGRSKGSDTNGVSDSSPGTMTELQPPERYQLPELESFKRPIADDDFEIDMPTNDETKSAAIYGKSSKSWRALRIAGRTRLAAFDKIEDPKKITVVFEEPTEADDDANEEADNEAVSEENMPSNKGPIIIVASSTETLSAVTAKLFEKHKGVFAVVVRHTTRAAEEGESNGKTFQFVAVQEFNQLRDGDRLVEYGERDGSHYGTSTKAIDAVTEAGKIPIIQLDIEAAQFAKDMDFEARYILLNSPDADDPAAEVYDAVIATDEDDLDAAAAEVGAFIYGGDGDENMDDEEDEDEDEDEDDDDDDAEANDAEEEESDTSSSGDSSADADMEDAQESKK